MSQVFVLGNFRGTVTFGDITKTALINQDIFIAKYSPGGNLLWVKTFGGSPSEQAYALAVDASGNIFITGYFLGTADFGSGPITSSLGIFGSDIFVAKYCSNGDSLPTQTCSDNTHPWFKHFGGSSGDNNGTAIAVDGEGNVIVAGQFLVDVNFREAGMLPSRLHHTPDSFGQDGFVLKLSGQTGRPLWATDFGGEDDDTVTGVAVDSFGDVVVVGYGDMVLNFGGDSKPTMDSTDFFIAKYAGVDGHYLWDRVIGNTGEDTVSSVGVDTDSNIFVTGTYGLTVDFGGDSLTAPIGSAVYLAKYAGGAKGIDINPDPTPGVLKWARSISVSQNSGGSVASKSLAVDSDGNVAITGNVTGDVDFGNGTVTSGQVNFYVAKYGPDYIPPPASDPNGPPVQNNYLWVKRSINTLPSSGDGIGIDKDRNVLSTGFVFGDVMVDDKTVSTPSQSSKSAFVLKVSP